MRMKRTSNENSDNTPAIVNKENTISELLATANLNGARAESITLKFEDGTWFLYERDIDREKAIATVKEATNAYVNNQPTYWPAGLSPAVRQEIQWVLDRLEGAFL